MKLDPLIQVGKCLSRGDMDYSVSLQKLTREELKEVVFTTHFALKVLTDNWLANNQPEQAQAMQVAPSSSTQP
jgi:hypothetical protein